MRKGLLIKTLLLCAPFGAVHADVLSLPEAQPAPPAVTLPAKGSTMADVQKNFGSPRSRQPTVGGGSPKQPPITRWDYDGFVVIFEKDRVVDAVIPGAPPRLYNKDALQPVAEAPPMPGAADAFEPQAGPGADTAPIGTAPGEIAEPAVDAPTTEATPSDAAPAEPAPAEAVNEATSDNPYPDRPPGE